MRYLNIDQAADELETTTPTVTALCKAGFFGRKLGNTWCITDKELEHFYKGNRSPPPDLQPIYDSQQVIAILGIGRAKFYRLVAKGQITGEHFGRRGGQPNLIFTEQQLEAAKRVTSDLPKNGYKTVPADKYIDERDGRFHITGTDLHYKTRTVARERARSYYKHALGVKLKL